MLVRKIFSWIFSRGALPYWCILLVDCMIVMLSGLVSFYIIYDGLTLLQNFQRIVLGLSVCLIVYIFSFLVFHTFRGVMRYSSFVDLHRLAYSTCLAGFGVCLLHQVQVHLGLTRYIIIPRFESAFVMFIIATMLMWALRVLVKSLHDNLRSSIPLQRVFIYGCLQGGVALAKSIQTETPARYTLSGFISPDEQLSGTWLMGVKVYDDNDDIVRKMQSCHVGTLFVSPIQSERFTRRTSLIDKLISAGIKILMMPPAEEWDGKSDFSHTRLHSVEIEELLPRDKIEVDMESIGRMLCGKSILITGAAGSIGSELSRQVARFSPSNLVLIDQAETPMHDERLYMSRNFKELNVKTIVGSITNEEQMEKIFDEYRPEYVFHAAAYKHVPMMEDNPGMAVQNNVYGTRVIADLSVKYGAKKFVMVSTDKAVNPTNVMGCSKRICEIYCQSLNAKLREDEKCEGRADVGCQFITTRFGNVLGSNGSVIPIFKEQIRNGGPVMVTHPDIIRYFMLIPEACKLVLEAGTMGKGGEIFVFDMGEPVRIVDLAKRMIQLSGASNVEIKFSGLRDGEKLYEEVLNDAEHSKPTVHPKIKVASVREYPYDLALSNEKELYDLSMSFDDMAIVKKMKEIVPEFKSRQSKYEVLDGEREEK